MKHVQTVARSAVLAAVLSFAALPAGAGEWKHEFAPYLWGAAMSGQAGVGALAADVDMSFGDILDDLELGFMGTYRATGERYVINVDAIYMGLGATEKGPGGALKADIDMDQLALEVDGGYRVTERLTALAGLRYVDLSGKVAIDGPLGIQRSPEGGADWVDPVVGAIYAMPLGDRWSTSLRGDVGGFGVGSDFSWQAIATLRWQATPTIGVLAAYRYLSMDYESGRNADYFKYDVDSQGPALGVVMAF